MKRHGKIDANQPEIVKTLRQAGASVAITSDLGDGFLDLVVGFRGANFLIEVKYGKNGLTPEQRDFFSSWRGQCEIARTSEEALRIIGA